MSDFLVVSAAALVAVALVMGIATLVARARQRVAVVDVAWGLGFVVIAVTCVVTGAIVTDQPVLGETSVRRWLVLGMVAVWGLRLAWHIRRRAVGHGEDPRYEELLGGSLEDVGLATAVRKVFLVQGLALWFISLPVQVAAVLEVDWSPVVLVGIAVWLLGLVFETVGDAQLAAYKQDPDRSPVMDRGLWAWTRHPNYFGDACVWWGLWLVGGLASGWLPGLLTVLAPVAMTYFLLFATGARLLEKSMMKRDGYPAYAERTPMFFPLPPKRR